MVVTNTGATRDAIFGVVDAERNAKITALINKGGAKACRPGFDGAVGDAPAIGSCSAQLFGYIEVAVAFLFVSQIEDFSA